MNPCRLPGFSYENCVPGLKKFIYIFYFSPNFCSTVFPVSKKFPNFCTIAFSVSEKLFLQNLDNKKWIWVDYPDSVIGILLPVSKKLCPKFCTIKRIWLSHRLISRDRPTKTGILCFWSTFFYVAALTVRI